VNSSHRKREGNRRLTAWPRESDNGSGPTKDLLLSALAWQVLA
jgi:hypothetical protein